MVGAAKRYATRVPYSTHFDLQKIFKIGIFKAEILERVDLLLYSYSLKFLFHHFYSTLGIATAKRKLLGKLRPNHQ